MTEDEWLRTTLTVLAPTGVRIEAYAGVMTVTLAERYIGRAQDGDSLADTLARALEKHPVGPLLLQGRPRPPL